MYSKESLTKFVNHANNLIKHYMSMDKNSLTVHISKGNRKIGHTMNVSILPLFTCANCKGCKEYCYDIKACLQYEKNVVKHAFLCIGSDSCTRTERTLSAALQSGRSDSRRQSAEDGDGPQHQRAAAVRPLPSAHTLRAPSRSQHW